MAYFDSAKNRAQWQEELSRLTREREKRERGEVPSLRGRSAVPESNPLVRKISFAELLSEEEKVIGEKKAKRTEALRKSPETLTAEIPSESKRKGL